MTSPEPTPGGAASERRRPSPFVAVLVALATVTLGVFCSAALADLHLGTLDFFQILPWLLLGEGLVYLVMLGGGSVAAPTLFTAWFLGFVFRAGIAGGGRRRAAGGGGPAAHSTGHRATSAQKATSPCDCAPRH